MIQRVVIGGSLKVTTTFRNFSDALTNPGTVALKIKPPLGVLVTVVPTNESVGVWSYVYTPLEVGKHFYRFEGTSPLVAVDEGSFFVDESKVIP